MPTAPLFDGPVCARRAPARRRPVASAAPTAPDHAPAPPSSWGSWQEFADSCLAEIETFRRARDREIAAYDREVRAWGETAEDRGRFARADDEDRRRLIILARRAGAALAASGWCPDEAARHALVSAGLIPAPTAPAEPAPRSILGEIAELPGRSRPARVGRDSALDYAPAERWRPASIRPAPTPERSPALTPREISALRKQERAARPAPTSARDLARAERRAQDERAHAQRAEREREQRRRVSGK